MKKVISFILALIMLLSMVSCDVGEPPEVDSGDDKHIHAYTYNLISYKSGYALEGHCNNSGCDAPTVIVDEGLVPEYEYIAPTCVNRGRSIWSYTKNGKTYTIEVSFDPSPDNHSFYAGSCINCGIDQPIDKPDDPETPEHTHSWINATCTTPKVCSSCGETSGNANGHSWVEATCTTPKVCSACGEISGTAHGHLWVAATCTTPKTCHACGEEGGTSLGHSYENGICTVCSEKAPEEFTPTDPTDEMAVFNAFFNPNNHISLKLDISNSELKKMQQDYEKYASMGSKSPIYRMADLIVTITEPDGRQLKWTIEQVGVRMKGNTSRTSFYNDWDGMYNLIHFKISFQETFEEVEYYGNDALVWNDSAAKKERKNRTFATLEKIDIRWNKNDDPTYIRESYAYDLYREFGVLAPHTNLASVDIGRDHAGVFVVYEPIDKIFLEKNLPEEALGGDLYKLGWTNEGATFTSFSSYGVEDEDNCKFYTYDLKTNKKTSTHESLKNFINTIKSSSATKASIEKILDIENFMNYCAVSYMIGNPDDLRNNYNNSYIYFRADTGKMIVIPYDMDRGLGVNKDWNPSGNGLTQDGPYDKKAYGNGDQRSPLFLKTVCQGGYFINEYTEALKRVDASEMLTNASFNEAYNTAKELYSSDTAPSKKYNNAGGHSFSFSISKTCGLGDNSNLSFYDYLKGKRATLYKAIGDQGHTDNCQRPTDSSIGGGNNGGEDNGSSGDNGNNGGNNNEAKPIENPNPYIFGEMNNWSRSESFKMTSAGDGIYTFTLTTSHVTSSRNRIKFKIKDENSGLWYGYEFIDPDCEINYNDTNGATNGNKNFYLAPGTYVVTFDTNTVTIYIEQI